MGTNDAFLGDNKTERICGSRRATGRHNKQARLEVFVDVVFPYWKKQPSVAFPEVKVAVGHQEQGLASILQHPWFLLGNVDPQLDSYWRQLFHRTAPKAEEPNCLFVTDDDSSFGKTGDGRTLTPSDPSLPVPAFEYAVLAVPNLGK